MLPYGRQSISEADIQAVVDVLRGDWLTTGPNVAEFESAVGLCAGGHPAVSTSSGTAALHIAYATAGVAEGDQIVTTPMTFIATASTASILGAQVVFADIEADTGLIDPASVREVVSGRTKVITAVDYAGQPADYAALRPIARDAEALLFADAAHSVGGKSEERPVGDLADVTALSFFPTKNFTTGEGGALIANEVEFVREAARFRSLGMIRDEDEFVLTSEGPWHQEVQRFGLNYRLTDIGAALGMLQLSRLDQFKRRRGQIVDRYNAAFATLDQVRTPYVHPRNDPMWHLYPLRILDGRRKEVYECLRASGIAAQVNYMPVYWHPVYASLGYKRGLCPVAERFYQEELSLPVFVDMTDADVDRVVASVISTLA